MVSLVFVETKLSTSPDDAAEFIKLGGICAFPTETVYGLGADVFNEKAVAKIFEAKCRPADNPLIAHVSSKDQIKELSSEITKNAHAFIDAFFPGPLTVVLRKSRRVPLIATAGLDTIGIRMPRFELAREFITACGVPVVAPSANLSGRPSPTTWQAVYEDLNGRIDCILQGEPTEIGLESTVVDCTGKTAIILRKGSISIEELCSVVPETIFRGNSELDTRSPGLRHKHYSPNAKVKLVDSIVFDHPQASAFIGLHEPKGDFDLMRVLGSTKEYAHSLFAFFRECDSAGIEIIFCETVDETGIGAALMDRLFRAAEA